MFKNNPALLQLRAGLTASVSTQKKQQIVEGVARGTRNAYGFLMADDGQSYFIAPPQMSLCFAGDRLRASILEHENGKTEAIIESILEPVSGTFLGTVRFRGQHPFIVPENTFFRNWFRLPRLKQDSERDGDIVVANIIKHPFGDGSCHAEILETICNERDKQAPWRLACARRKVKFESPVFDLDDVPPLKSDDEPVIADMRDIPFVTIDGEFTRDIDDALYAKQLEDGSIELLVAIADAGRFMIRDSKTDTDAFSRGFTTYMPGLVITMLPKVLSDQGASLVEDEDRQTICCTMRIDEHGNVHGVSFKQALIRSRAKLSYEAVQSFLDGDQGALPESVHGLISVLDQVCTRRGLWREQNALTSSGYSDFRFVVEDFELKSLCKSEQTRSQKLVEECMVAANISFAQFMHQHNLPCIYRSHHGFKPERLDALIELLKHFDIKTDTKTVSSLDGYRTLMRRINAMGNEQLEYLLRGFTARGVHAADYAPHFSLGVEGYATFTSPIRKYSDLINHRSIKNYLSRNGQREVICQETLEHMNERASATDQASRDVHKALYARHYQPKLGTVSRAKVTSVSTNGARIELMDTGASAFIATRSLTRRHDVVMVSDDCTTLLRNGLPVIKLAEELNVVVEFIDLSSSSINCAPTPAR